MAKFLTLNELGVDSERTTITEGEARQLAEQLYDEYLVDYLRSLQGWQIVGGQGSQVEDQLDEDARNREWFVRRSRILARREPLSKQAVRLYTTYSGMLKVEFKAKSGQFEKIWKEKFWELRANRRILKSRHRRKLSNNLLTDGEIFFALFVSPNGEVRIRTVDPLQIPPGNIITHPEDVDTPLFYKRQVPRKRNERGVRAETTESPETNIKYYRDWELEDETLEEAVEAGFEMPPEEQIAEIDGEPILMFHLPFDPHGLRGNGLLFAVLSYTENFRNFLQDRATIVRGLSTYIRTITVKGGSKATGDIAARLRSAFSLGGSRETNPPDATGSDWIQNQNLTKQETPPITNAGDAMNDARIFRQPIASGVGITEANLTGDPSIGNLASQAQMDGPQLQNFLDYQQLLEEALKDLWMFVLEKNGITTIEGLDVSMPDIIRLPLTDLANVMTAGLQNKLIPKDEAARQFMMSLGTEDIEKQLKQLGKEREDVQQQPGVGASTQPGQQPPQKPQQQDKNGNNLPSTQQRELGEGHGTKIVGICPICGSEGTLIAEHDVNFCTSCQNTFNPSFFMVEAMAEKLQEVLNVSDEDWKLVEEAMFGEVQPNGKDNKIF